MPFRFVHTADIHLDSPLRSLALRNPDLAELIGSATRLAFERTISLCLEERVDALMIAGDLYDGDQTSMKTALFLAAQLQRLSEASIRVFIVRGNHDAQSRITRELVLPDLVTVFGGRGETVQLERQQGDMPVAVHGISFARPQAPESLVPRFKAPVANAFNIGLLHTSLSGASGHDDYAPCSVAELGATGFDYWCLGHVHKRVVHSENPFIVMPGMPQGRDIGEPGAKSVTLVSVADDGAVDCRSHATGVAQFERLTVDVSGAEERRDVNERIGAGLDRARDRATADHLVVRLKLNGETDLAWWLRRNRDVVEAEAIHRAEMAEQTWIEGIEMAVSPSTVSAIGPIEEIEKAVLENVAPSNSFRSLALDMVEELAKALPPSARIEFGDNEQARKEILGGLIRDGCEDVLAHLHEAGRERTD